MPDMDKLTAGKSLPVLLIAALAIISLWSCDERDVPFVVDEDEIIRYINEVPQARELFRTANLITDDPYTVPFDSGTYTDSLLSKSRSYIIDLITDKNSNYYYVDYGNLGLLREAVVLVIDSFEVQTTRQYTASTVVDTSYRELARYAFFLKLGDDSKDYVGWLLWGYNGLGDINPPVTVEAQRYDLSTFRGDLAMYLERPKNDSLSNMYYVKLVDIDSVLVGSRLRFTVERLSNNPATYTLISDYSTEGAFMERMVQADSPDVDTLSYKTESADDRYYRTAFFQAFTEDQGKVAATWCVPYRR